MNKSKHDVWGCDGKVLPIFWKYSILTVTISAGTYLMFSNSAGTYLMFSVPFLPGIASE
jgi:hypothetical protein